MSHSPSSRPALIVVDVQHAFDQWEAAGKRRNNPQALTRIVELLNAFRACVAPVFHIRHEGTRPNSSFLPGGTGYPAIHAMTLANLNGEVARIVSTTEVITALRDG
jgi:nicotinamidase-related amidase